MYLFLFSFLYFHKKLTREIWFWHVFEVLMLIEQVPWNLQKSTLKISVMLSSTRMVNGKPQFCGHFILEEITVFLQAIVFSPAFPVFQGWIGNTVAGMGGVVGRVKDHCINGAVLCFPWRVWLGYRLTVKESWFQHHMKGTTSYIINILKLQNSLFLLYVFFEVWAKNSLTYI